MLLRNDAEPDLASPAMSYTALQIACRDGDEAIANLLIECGAGINAPPADEYGAAGLQFAERCGR